VLPDPGLRLSGVVEGTLDAALLQIGGGLRPNAPDLLDGEGSYIEMNVARPDGGKAGGLLALGGDLGYDLGGSEAHGEGEAEFLI
jgi:hypothetical protein